MKMKLTMGVLSLLSSALLLVSCSKDDEHDGSTFEVVDATISWSGEYAVDGCGYSLLIGEAWNKPVNESDIPDSYKENSPTNVEVKIINYHRNVNVCRLGIAMNSIKILDIRRK